MMDSIKDYSEKEEEIFRAAIDEFSQFGKKGARLQSIAEKADCNKTLIHYYFRNKDQLYEEVFDYHFTHFFMSIHEAITDAPTFKETLVSFVDQFMEFLKEVGPYPILMLKEMDMESKKKRFEGIKEKTGTGAVSLFKEKMKQAVERGEIRDLDARHTFMSITGACIQLFIAYPMLSLSGQGSPERKDNFIEEHKKHVIELIYDGLRTKKSTTDNNE
jgi:TetR/AcrR family transcriptional regulator